MGTTPGNFIGRIGNMGLVPPSYMSPLTPKFLPDGTPIPPDDPQDPQPPQPPLTPPPSAPLASQIGGIGQDATDATQPDYDSRPLTPAARLGGNIVPPPPENQPQFKQAPQPPQSDTSPLPTPPVAPNTPGGKHIPMWREIIGGLIGSQSPILRPAAEKIAQGEYPAQQREYERQMAIRKAQSADTAAQAGVAKTQAEAGEAGQRGRLFGEQATALEKEGKFSGKSRYMLYGNGGIYDTQTQKTVVEPSDKQAKTIQEEFIRIMNDDTIDPAERARRQDALIKAHASLSAEQPLDKQFVNDYLRSHPGSTLPDAMQAYHAISSGTGKDDKAIKIYQDEALKANPKLTTDQAYSIAYAKYVKQNKVDPGVLRIEALAETKPITVIDSSTGQAETMNMSEFNRAQNLAPGRYVQASTAAPAMQKHATFSDIQYNIDNARRDIGALATMDAGTRAELANALADDSGGRLNAFMSGSVMTTMLPQQRNAVISIKNLYENAMMVRQIGGMGQGSDELRRAILSTLPSAKSPDVPYMLTQLDRFEGMVQNLHQGIPGLGGPAAKGRLGGGKVADGGRANQNSGQSASPDFPVTDPRGVIHHFPTQQQANTFKQQAGIQ